MELFNVRDDGRFSLAVPITKYNEATGEFEGWLAVEELDKSNEIIDLTKSLPHFQAWQNGFAKATDGQSYGNVREQHDPRKAAGKLIAPIETGTTPSGDAGWKVRGLAVDPVSKQKLADRVLVALSIGGEYVEKTAADDVKEGATRYVAKPSEISLVDNPCMPSALITVVKVDGKEEIAKAVGFNPTQGFQCRAGAFHVKKDEARRCDDPHAEIRKISASERDALPDSAFALPKERKYPIDTAARARDALSRVSANGTPEEQAKVRAAVRRRYPKIDVGGKKKKADDSAELQKCLFCVAQLASALGSVEFVDSMHEYQEDTDPDPIFDEADQAVDSVVEQLFNALIDYVAALKEEYLGEEAAEDAAPQEGSTNDGASTAAAGQPAIDGPQPTGAAAVGGREVSQAAINASTDDAPVAQLAARIATLRKRARTLLTKSLHVHTGNGSSNTQPKEAPMQEAKKETATPEKAKVEEVKPAEKAAGDGELSKAAIDQFAKAAGEEFAKRLEPITAKIDAIEKSQKDTDGVVARLAKALATIVNAPAASRGIKRVTKAEDSRGETIEHDKAAKKSADLTPMETMSEIMKSPSGVAYGSGLIAPRSEAAAAE